MFVLFLSFILLLSSCCTRSALDENIQHTGLQNPESKDFSVAIDIGHTVKHPGVMGARGIGEFFFNQNLSVMLQTELSKKGYATSFIINPKGEDISLQDRTRIAKEKKADILISLHHDSAQPKYLSKWVVEGDTLFYSDEFQGYSLFYSEKSTLPKESFRLATLLGQSFRQNHFRPTLHHAEAIDGENRPLIDKEKGVYRFDDLVVLKTSTIPAVLIECGVLINRDEELLLTNPVYQRMLVLSIVQAIETFRMQQKKG
ncbi:MAG: N-acetylmuramoyl-L-alanine amidase [Fibrobacteria bacterium]|nr:N-acetylmuramoyl-L-alanine amidase [Fibrobacteria bacterium]